jgi:DNA-binding response OmpR family regulator
MEGKKEKAKILIIEDNKMLLDIYITVFEKEGYTVITAQTGEDGYAFVGLKKPNLVLLDILLPGKMNGLDVLRKLKADEETKNIPVLIMSNLSDDKTISEGLSLGASGYFTKSQAYPDDVLRNVATILSKN